MDVHELFHKFAQTEQTITACCATYFVILLYLVGADTWIPYEEGYWFGQMGAYLYRGRVVWQYSNTDRFLPSGYFFVNRTYDTSVKIIYAF